MASLVPPHLCRSAGLEERRRTILTCSVGRVSFVENGKGSGLYVSIVERRQGRLTTLDYVCIVHDCDKERILYWA